jgi:ketosteroid isomerase-like protein
MKNKIKLMLMCSIFCLPSLLFAQSKEQKQVEEKVEQLRKAMVDGDSVMLDKLAAENLLYRHSGGHFDDKKEFVHKLVSGGSDFVTIELLEQKVSVINKKLVVVYHTLEAKTNDNGKPADVHLYVMLVWEKQHGDWKLVARQAAKKV